MDLKQHLIRQMAFSRATFGTGQRTLGVIDHIRKELVEVEKASSKPDEWVDVVILALDGMWRSVREEMPGASAESLADMIVQIIVEKQGRNERRDWPDWRAAPVDKAIEHVR